MKTVKMGMNNTGPLRDIRILDLSRLLAGNFLSFHLAELGADVVKIENTRQGDPLRDFTTKGKQVSWKILCRNKRSLSLNYTTDARGRELLFRLLENAHGLIENFKPGGMEKFGLAPEALHRVNPRLVIVRVSGWGQDGPYSHKPGFGTLVEAFSGYAAKSGFPDSEPLLPNLGLADMITGVTGAFSLLSAIREVEVNGGRGQVIDLSLLDGITSFLGIDPAICRLTGKPIPRLGNRGEVSAPRNLYRSSDGRYIAISASMQSMFDKLFIAIGQADLLDDPRFRTNEDRVRNSDKLDEILGAFIARRSARDNLDFFEKNDVTAGPLYDAVEILNDPHVQERGVYVSVDDPDLGPMPVPNIAARLSATPGSLRTHAPKLGEHTEEILHALGLTGNEIAGLEAEQVIKCNR